MSSSETIGDIRSDVKKHYAKFYWSEDGLTEDGDIPTEKTIEPAEFLERVAKACRRRSAKRKKRVWMVTIDGSSHGDYENNANSILFATFEEAKKFVEEDIQDLVVNGPLMGKNYTDEELEQEIRDHATWYGSYEVQYRDLGSVTDYKIEPVLVPEKKGKTK